MTVVPASELVALARSVGLDAEQAVIAAAIAIGESGGRSDAMGDVGLANAQWGPSVGLWQVRSLNAQRGTGGARDAAALTNIGHNARAMASISGGGRNWQPWSVYTSGAYRQHLPAARNSAGAGAGVVAVGQQAIGSALDKLPGVGGVDLPGLPGIPGLDALAPVGQAFAALLNPATYVRVLKVTAGLGLIIGGVLIVNRDALGAVAGVAAQVVPVGKVASVAKGAAGKAVAGAAAAKGAVA